MFQHLGKNQMKEIIHASNFLIFFIDEHQRVTFKDAGRMEDIKRFADETRANLSVMQLESQFRCNGSDGYLAWVDNALQIRETANANYFGLHYDFRVYSNPNKLREEIERLNKTANKSRMLAGYCWNWDKEGKADPDYHDIVLNDFNFRASWNRILEIQKLGRLMKSQ